RSLYHRLVLIPALGRVHLGCANPRAALGWATATEPTPRIARGLRLHVQPARRNALHADQGAVESWGRRAVAADPVWAPGIVAGRRRSIEYRPAVCGARRRCGDWPGPGAALGRRIGALPPARDRPSVLLYSAGLRGAEPFALALAGGTGGS